MRYRYLRAWGCSILSVASTLQGPEGFYQSLSSHWLRHPTYFNKMQKSLILMRTMDFGKTVVIQLSNDATSTATKLNGDLVSRCQPHLMEHHAHDSAAGFRETPHPLMSSTLCAINRNIARPFAVPEKKQKKHLHKHYVRLWYHHRQKNTAKAASVT